MAAEEKIKSSDVKSETAKKQTTKKTTTSKKKNTTKKTTTAKKATNPTKKSSTKSTTPKSQQNKKPVKSTVVKSKVKEEVALEKELEATNETIIENEKIEQDNIQLQPTLEVNQEEPKKHKKSNKPKKYHIRKFYIGYYTRLFFNILLTIGLFVAAGILLYKSFNYIPEKKVNYKQKSNIDYQVYLKPNDFFETPYLNKGMSYIASLIDHLDISFNYDFDIDKNSDVDFTYDIIGKLTIEDNEENVYFSKDYILLDKQTDSIKNQKQYKLQQKINIDYEYYNNLANTFKTSYGVSTVSKLKVILNVKNNGKDETKKINDSNNISLSIPLSAKSINVELNQNEINDKKSLIEKAKITMNNQSNLICSIILFILGLLFFIKTVKLIFKTRIKTSEYDKYIKRLLLEYDRLIVETSYCPDFKNFEVINVSKFSELLDVRDNLKLPITYYNVQSHNKCYFYILNNSIIYLVTIKSVDFNKK